MSSAATPIDQSQTISVQPPLPPAQLFDILPTLHALLSRLESSLNTYTASATSTDAEPLSYKDAGTAVQAVKARMRKAVAELGKLADMDRSVEEQHHEIESLEQKIEAQEAMLRKLGEIAGGLEHKLG